MALDEHLRSRLRELAQAERTAPETSHSAEALVAAMRVEQARHRRRRVVVGTSLLAAAAAATLALWPLPASEGEPLAELEPAADRVAEQPAPPAHAAAHPPSGPSTMCLRPVPAWQPASDGQQRALIEDEVLWVRDADSNVELAWREGCDHTAQLHAGSIAVHAMDLRHKALRVRVPIGDVRVVGTAFEVQWQADDARLTVRVVEGTVRVALDTGEPLDVRSGHSLQVQGTATPELRNLAEAEARALWRRLGVAPPQAGVSDRPRTHRVHTAGDVTPAGANTDPAALELPEERIWHSGTPDVRPPGYQPGNSSVQPDGRPMKKPRVVH